MYPLLITGEFSRFLRWFSLLFVLCGLLTPHASARDLKRFSNDGANPSGDEFVRATITVASSGVSPGQYFIKMTSGIEVGSTQPGFFQNWRTVTVAANGAVSLGDINYSPKANPAVVDFTRNAASTYEIRYEVRTGSFSGPVVHSQSLDTLVWKMPYVIVPFVSGGNATPIPVNYTVALGADPCPPRDLTFEIDLAIQAGQGKPHAVLVSLQINNLAPLELVGPETMIGPVQMDLAPTIPNVPGAFTYKWLLNGKPIVTGTYGCGDEIANNTITDFATPNALELEDQDGDGIPDNQDTDVDGDGVPNDKETDPIINTPPPGTNAGPGAPVGSVGTPIQQPGTALPQPNPTGGGGGGSGTTGDVNVLNVKDFGNAFKWAFEEAGNANGFFPAPGNGADPTGLGVHSSLRGIESDELSTAPIEDWEEAWDKALADAGELRNVAGDTVTAMVSHKPVKPTVPTPVGVWRFNVGDYFNTLFGQSYFDIDLRPYAQPIGMFRQCFEWLLMVIAWFKFWNYFRSMLAI